MRHLLSTLGLLLLAALLTSCRSAPVDDTRPKPPDPVVDETPDVEEPPPSAHAQAQADVQRLRAQADKHELLAAWSGDHGGVPPFDKVTAAELPDAFTL